MSRMQAFAYSLNTDTIRNRRPWWPASVTRRRQPWAFFIGANIVEIIDHLTGMQLSRLRVRFWNQVNKKTESGCWEWVGATLKNGAGAVGVHQGRGKGSKVYMAHYVSWALAGNLMPDDTRPLQRCGNSTCVRPDHLYLGRVRPENDVDNQVKQKASLRIMHEVRMGRAQPASERKCKHCGGQAQSYHHYLGYDERHWLDVIPLCRSCHYRAEFEEIP